MRKTVDFIQTLLEQQPLMALFITIALGYLVYLASRRAREGEKPETRR